MILQLPGFPDGGFMPRKYSCQGKEISPEVEWMELPEGTKSLVLFMYDISIPVDLLRLYKIDHWVVYNIPPEVNRLPEGVSDETIMEKGARQGIRWGGKRNYMGPCPLLGTHLYVFELYSLKKMLEIRSSDSSRRKITEQIQSLILEKSVYSGKYKKYK
jgi:Raf kinase inhibitor-like YbhB/YbcL family protein